jgi:hypothetical protein
MSAMTKAERDQLIALSRRRARQAEREAEMREKVLLAEVIDLMTAEFQAEDRLWKEAVTIAQEAAAKANAHIRTVCADLGIPPDEAPQVRTGWEPRGSSYRDRERRAELRKLAETRLTALTKTAKAAIQAEQLRVEEQLVLGGLRSDEAREFLASMPGPEQLMPPLSLDDLGVKRWQPPEDAAGQLTTPLTPAQRKQRQVRRAIEANPGVSDREIGRLTNVDHKTVAKARRDRGELPAISGEIPTASGELPTTDEEEPHDP